MRGTQGWFSLILWVANDASEPAPKKHQKSYTFRQAGSENSSKKARFSKERASA